MFRPKPYNTFSHEKLTALIFVYLQGRSNVVQHTVLECVLISPVVRDELSYLAPLGSENISAPYFKQCFFRGGGITPHTETSTTPPSPKTEITIFHFIY